MRDSIVTAYLVHFSRPLRHARHYIGVTTRVDDIEARLAEHRAGRGARICAVAVAEGIDLVLARTWPNVPWRYEVRLKAQGGASRLCPLCKSLATSGTEAASG